MAVYLCEGELLCFKVDCIGGPAGRKVPEVTGGGDGAEEGRREGCLLNRQFTPLEIISCAEGYLMTLFISGYRRCGIRLCRDKNMAKVSGYVKPYLQLP